MTQQLLAQILRRHPESRLAGTPMSLASVVATAPSREIQSGRIEAYWDLTSAVADYYLGLREVENLRALRNDFPTYSQQLGAAQSKLATRIDTSLKAARSAQYKLARRMGTDVMPLPADTPFTGPYATRFESVFPAGAPQEALLLRDLIPLRLAELQDAADDLTNAEDWADRVRNNRGATEVAVIQALKLKALTRRAFVQLARDYNLQINRYSQLAAPELVDTPRLVAMLLRTGRPTPATAGRDLVADSLGGFSPPSSFRSGAASRR